MTPPSDSIFGLSAQGIYYIVRDAAKKAGLGTLAPHDLRRTMARLAREGGAPIEQIQMSLGHASVATTERYIGAQLQLRQGRAAGDFIGDPDGVTL
jgi:integrase/recombinase XerD